MSPRNTATTNERVPSTPTLLILADHQLAGIHDKPLVPDPAVGPPDAHRLWTPLQENQFFNERTSRINGRLRLYE